MTYAQKKNDPRYLGININGNLKLRNTETVRFMIWNLPAVKTCPFRTEHCEKSCYARKAEKVYPGCAASREKNFTESKKSEFVENMIFTIETELETKKYSNKQVIFRIHESGDFYNLNYAKKWLAIARHFENDPRITFLAYTKSIWFFVANGYGMPTFPQNLVIRSSLWDDTTDENRILTILHDFPIYTALSRDDMNTAKKDGRIFTECRCEDCANCGKCWDNSEKEIICEIH